MKKIAIYTAIFGPYDGLIPQPQFPGIDYICFTDQPFRSKTWEIRQTQPADNDPARASRKIKINPHLYLPEYDYSVFIDGNYLVKADLRPLVEQSLRTHPMAIFDHNQCEDARDCIFQEYEALIRLSEKGILKDDPNTMQKQINRYIEEQYPPHNGLIFSACLIRKHHEKEVIKTMELWWQEVKSGSKRDQLSFNYAAWKTGLNFTIVDGDLRSNQWLEMLGKHRKSYQGKLFRYRIKKLLGIS